MTILKGGSTWAGWIVVITVAVIAITTRHRGIRVRVTTARISNGFATRVLHVLLIMMIVKM